jgi:hypothetical protein
MLSCPAQTTSFRAVGVRAHLHRRHDVQLHQGGGVRTRHHLRPPAGGDEGHHPPERRGVGHTGPHRHLLPSGHHIQLRAGTKLSLSLSLKIYFCPDSLLHRIGFWTFGFAGAPAVRFRNVRRLHETLPLVTPLISFIFTTLP